VAFCINWKCNIIGRTQWPFTWSHGFHKISSLWHLESKWIVVVSMSCKSNFAANIIFFFHFHLHARISYIRLDAIMASLEA
jgi:hypothetical protein